MNSRHISLKLENESLSSVHIQYPEPEPQLLHFNDLMFKGQLGTGSYARVWSGQYKEHNVAIKKFLINKPEKIKREAQVMADLSSSPYVVNSFGYCLHESCPSLVIELMETSLYALLRKVKKLDWDIIIQIAFDVISGLRDIHDKGYIHLDVKSDNILLSQNSPTKLGDFGLTRKQTETKKVAGSIYWMAPEVARDQENTFKSDIYSFGMTLLELTLGQVKNNPKSFKRLIEGFSSLQFIRLVRDNFEKINKIFSIAIEELKIQNCPSILIDVIQECLQENPEQRPTATQIVERLKPFRKKDSQPLDNIIKEVSVINSSSFFNKTPSIQKIEFKNPKKKCMIM